MDFRMLGPFEAWHGDVQVDLGDLQQRYILVVLLLHVNKPVSPDRLIEIVWGENRPRTNLVTGYVAKIRKAFKESGAEDVAIATTPTGYVLRIDEERLDTVRFIRLCDRASTTRHDGNPTEATQLLHEAVGLWRGRFLEDLDIDRIGGSEVISLDDLMIDALGDLAELELLAGNHRWVRDRLRPALAANPSRQRLAILLMRALLANDDQVEAVRIYHQTRDALDEFGMETSPDLRGLAWLAQYGEPRSTLPPRPVKFTGRGDELKAIESIAAELSDGGEPRMVWLSGMPGVGKTTLAVEAAHLLGKQFTDARLFVALNGFTPNVEPIAPTEALAQLLTDLGVPTERVPPRLTERMTLYQAKLAGTSTMVVLDNAMSEDQVRPLLPDAPGCFTIVTSRWIGDLDAADNIRIAPLPPQEAADLFGKLVGTHRLRGRAPQVDTVVDRCGRLPLQIRVVASQFRRHDLWPIEHLVGLLTEDNPWATTSSFDEDGVIACLVSYRALTESQQTLFRLFGLFPGQDLSVHGAAALTRCAPPEARSLLDNLHQASLLEELVPGRYHMLDPLKKFATTVPQPADPDEPREALDRLLDYYLATVSTAIATAYPFDHDRPAVGRTSPVTPVFDNPKAALAWLATERANLVAAIRYAANHQRPEHTWQLALLLWRYFNTAGQLEDWIETLELAKHTVMADQDNLYGQAQVLLRLSAVHWRTGHPVQALELAAQALPRWVRLGDRAGEANTLSAIAFPTMELGDHEQAIAHFEAALRKFEEAGDARGQANALSMIGHLDYQHGRIEEAERRERAAVALERTIDDARGLAHALDNLGSVQQRLGQLAEAIANHEEARRLAVEIGDRSLEAYALNYLGTAHCLLGDLETAVRYQAQAKTVADTVSDADLRTQLYLDRGATSLAIGDQRGGLAAYRAALDLASGTGNRGQRAHANHGIAKALHATGDHEQAAAHWSAAETDFTELRQPEADEIRQEREQLDCACG